jgi:hypothetical protein
MPPLRVFGHPDVWGITTLGARRCWKIQHRVVEDERDEVDLGSVAVVARGRAGLAAVKCASRKP